MDFDSQLTSNSYADGLLRRYESGWRWEPSQQCPDGTQCKRGDAFLRHDAECGSWEQCGGKKCCLTCEQMTRSYSTCERACSKAKAARKEKNDKEKEAEEKRREKEANKTKRAISARAVRLLAAADAAGLDDKTKFRFDTYGDTWTVGKLRKFAAGDFEGERYYSSDLDPDKIRCVPDLVRTFKCSADYILGLTDELHPAAPLADQPSTTKGQLQWYSNKQLPEDGQRIVYIEPEWGVDNDIYQSGALKSGERYGIKWESVILWTPEPEWEVDA